MLFLAGTKSGEGTLSREQFVPTVNYIVDRYIDNRYIGYMSKTENRRKQATFLTLMALLDGPKHGYDVAKFIEERSNGFFRMPFGTLYPILHSLEKEGLVTVELNEETLGRPKKIYKLTKTGKQQAQDEVSEFHLFSKAVHKMVTA